MAAFLPLLCLCLATAQLAGAPEALTREDARGTHLAPSLSQRKVARHAPSPEDHLEDGLAEWTSWFNVDHPGGDGDFESLEAIRFYYGERLCAHPLALEARTTEWELPSDVGERVHYSLERGFWCLNREQPEGKSCSNYHVRFKCPLEPVAWSAWSAWSPCSQSTCGVRSRGIQTRQRRCLGPQPLWLLHQPPCAGPSEEQKPCPASLCSVASWSEWGAWGPCSGSCGPGRRLRRRRCPGGKKNTCIGRSVEAQKCVRPPCPGCHSNCVQGVANKDCSGCVCQDHVLVGTVVTPAGRPLPGARVTLKGRPKPILATTDARGSFRVAGICSDGHTNVSVQLEGFAQGLGRAVTSNSTTASVAVILPTIEKPYLVKHPESRIREAGQHVMFCCKALGTPVPKKYYWYHNGSLLDRKVYKYDSSLVLRNLGLDQAGTYHCKANSDAGTIKSNTAVLTVLAPGQQVCDPHPLEHLIKLPDDCRQAASGSTYYNVGLCPDTRCPGRLGSNLRCGESGDRCCSVSRLETREIQCVGYVLPVKVVAKCGCEKCMPPKVLVRGRVVAADTEEPLRFAQILLGKEKTGFTGYQGDFTIEVPPATERLVVTFVDGRQEFVDAIKVLPFDPRGGGVYQEVKVMRKKEPISLDSSKSNTIPLGTVEGLDPIGELVLPASAFYYPNGELYNGTVQASVTFLDPRDIATAASASSDLNFVDANGELAPLRTYGMFLVDLRAAGSGEELQTGPVEVRVDAGQIHMAGHAEEMKLWSLNPNTGLWEEESNFATETGGHRVRREERTFLIGNVEIRERRLFNLDVPERRRCFVKVRAYINDKYIPSEQVEGVVVTLVNLEPAPGYSANPRAWGRFDSTVTGPNGACLPAFCDAERADAYTAYITAVLGGEELEPAPSSPRPHPGTVGVTQPYLDKLDYRRTDHEDPALKKNGFRINLAKPNPNNLDEIQGPIYPWRSLRECEDAPVSANHFRFSRVEADKYEYNVVPFRESELSSWTGDYLSWWPNPQEFRACFIKVKIQGPQDYMVRSHNAGGSHPRTQGQLYGLRDARSVRDMERPGTSAACVEFKCSGMLFDQRLSDRTLVTLIPQGSCRRVTVNSLLREYLARHPPVAPTDDPTGFSMIAPVDPLGHNYGIYTVTDQNPRLAKEIAIGRCFDGTSDGFSREMKADVGIAVTFQCQERPAGQRSLFQRLLESPRTALEDIRREMGGAGRRSLSPSATRRVSGRRRRMEMLQAGAGTETLTRSPEDAP
ncbi:cartilage intermediate layer protein 2 [Petaurus breviceps papuanus]|uniref:cartilage intermediate layer protein 2 n=1 Tax=Petaurus breviceps papuanus TaxID=3040969 RepID=UPI0036DAB504